MMSMNAYSAEMKIGVIDQPLALFGTNYAAKNSKNYKFR